VSIVYPVMKSVYRFLRLAVHAVLYLVVGTSLLQTSVIAQQRAVSVPDCVSIRRVVDGPLLSSTGKDVAFVIKSPDLASDHNQYELRVRSVASTSDMDGGRVLLRSTEQISQIRWLDDGIRLTALIGHNLVQRKPSRIVVVNSRSAIVGEVKIPNGALDYTTSFDGNEIAYLTSVEPPIEAKPYSDPMKVNHGFYIPSGYDYALLEGKGAIQVMKSSIWLMQKSRDHSGWRKRLIIPPSDAGGVTGEKSAFSRVTAMSMSPNGRYLAIAYELQSSLGPWSSNRTVMAYRTSYHVAPIALGLYDVAAGTFLVIPRVPFPRSPIWWSSDSTSFATISASPIDSRWEKVDLGANPDPKGAGSFHVFAVEIPTMRLSKVLDASAAAQGVTMLSWKRGNGEMAVGLGSGQSLRLLRSDDEWDVESRFEQKGKFEFSAQTTLDGRYFVGLHEETTMPPDLWSVNAQTKEPPIRFTNLNPQIKGLEFGEGEDITWNNKYGALVSGRLLTPPRAGTRAPYPLVVMLAWPDKTFVCDAQYTTAFPPIPLVDAGFAVVMFNVYDAYSSGSSQPAGPPMIKEAESMVASVEALVDYLDRRGIASKENVGLIGFSRSSWKVDYLITHSDLKLRAASSADGGLGNYGGIWIEDGGAIAEGEMAGYGGTFFASRSQWLAGAPAFNADKVHTPLLMEYTGGGFRDQPLSAYEFHTELVNLHKPVELFFYPRGAHPLDTPFERVASLQRNVDWFRFWMQDKEGTAPHYDPDQFDRWRKLKVLQKVESRSEAAQALRLIP
jgi:dipeptidyl aminopeptidase/acylaminoacyl peptidase